LWKFDFNSSRQKHNISYSGFTCLFNISFTRLLWGKNPASDEKIYKPSVLKFLYHKKSVRQFLAYISLFYLCLAVKFLAYKYVEVKVIVRRARVISIFIYSCIVFFSRDLCLTCLIITKKVTLVSRLAS